ncbi:hypothetical protein C5167_008930, partial [Papaver somniferum]
TLGCQPVPDDSEDESQDEGEHEVDDRFTWDDVQEDENGYARDDDDLQEDENNYVGDDDDLQADGCPLPSLAPFVTFLCGPVSRSSYEAMNKGDAT